MTGKEYLNSLADIKTDKKKSNEMAALYADDLPEIILKIMTNVDETVFLDDSRVLSYNEVVNAEKDLHVSFKDKGIIPLVDCYDNDFIVYHFKDKIWSKFNIVDETVFKKKDSLEELLK